jgi:glycosyltransferase involved in cell wall biosynthesis
MTAYNASETIARAIKSTLHAMPKDAELVVHDDGSVDGTSAILDNISDSRLRRLPVVGNLGYARGRQRLVADTDSELIAVMDADDVTLPWRFQCQLPDLGRADAIVSPVVRFSTDPLRVSLGLPGPVTPRVVPFLLTFGCPLAHPTLLMKRSALSRVGGYRDVVAEDFDLYIRLISENFVITQGALHTVAYRNHSLQTSRKHGFNRAIEKDEDFQAAFDIFVESSFGIQRSRHATLLDHEESRVVLRLARSQLSRIEMWRVLRYAAAQGVGPSA